MHSFMTSRDARWLAIGILIGVAVGGAVGLYLLRQNTLLKNEAVPVAGAPSGDITKDAAVQLSANEQKKIGLETVVVDTTQSVLTVPRDAVIDTGESKVVFVARDNGIFQKQQIRVASPVKDRYPVLEGLSAGDRVVARGVFLVDSQTRLTGGMTGLFGGSKSYTDSAGAYKMTFRIDPDPPKGAEENTLRVTLTDAGGKPVSDAQVRANFMMPAMPAMNMPEMRNGTELKWTGTDYAGRLQIMMGGGWNVSVEARRGGEILATVQTQINAR
jgi:hypothetical protein